MSTVMTTTPAIHLDPKLRETPETSWLNHPIAVLPSDANSEVIGVLSMLRTADDPRDGLCAILDLPDGSTRDFIYAGPSKNVAHLRGPRSDKWIARNALTSSGEPRERKPRTGRTLNMATVPEAQIDEIYAMADAAMAAAEMTTTGIVSPMTADDIAAIFAPEATIEAFDLDTPDDVSDADALAAFDASLDAEYGVGPEPEQDAAIAELVAEAKAEDDDLTETREVDPDAYQSDPDDVYGGDLSPEQKADALNAMVEYAASKLKQPRKKSTGPRSGAKRSSK